MTREYIDLDTGEIIPQPPTKKINNRCFKDIREEDVFIEVVASTDPYVKINKTNVCYKSLSDIQDTDYMDNDTLSVYSARYLKHLCKNVVAWNTWFGDLQFIPDNMEYKRTKHFEVIKDLKTRGLVKVYDQLDGTNYHKVDIDPVYVWKGNRAFQDMAITLWHTPHLPQSAVADWDDLQTRMNS